MKTILITLFCILFYSFTNAQTELKAKSLLPVKYGVKIGGNIGNTLSNANVGTKNLKKTSVFGVSAGFYVQIALNDKWYINPELIYIQKGLSASSEYIHTYEINQQALHKVSHELLLAYVELNPTLSFKASNKIALNFGPSISTQISSDYNANDKGEHDALSTHEDLEDWEFSEETLDIGLNIGLSYHFNENFILDSKINSGFMKIGEISKDISSAGISNNNIKQNIFELRNSGVVISFIYLF